MFQTFLNILGVIGIVILAAFIIVFLSDLFISIVDGTNGIFFKRNKNKKSKYDDDDDKPTKRPVLLNKPHEETVVEKTSVEERNFEKSTVVEKTNVEEEKPVDLEAAKKEEEMLKNSNRQNIVDQRQELNTQQKPVIVTPPPAQKPQPQKEEKEEDIDKLISEISKQTLVEYEKQAEQENAKKEKEEAVKKQEELENKQKSLEEEIEKLKKQIANDKSTIEELENQVKENANKVVETKVSGPVATKEELENRLEVLRQRLKDNEKELAVNKKEFLPLRRVNLTLENDKKKLRRREAIVAKQKVVLYGVNNYVDIDEEKAKKLSEELDLLEGLRLSVQHCEEVMQKNKDRYPILERANKFLVKSNGEIKEDIANLEQQLKDIELKEEENSDND